MEQQGTQLETLQQRNLLLHEENNVLKEKIHNLERCTHEQKNNCIQYITYIHVPHCTPVLSVCRRLQDLKAENTEMSQALPSKDACIRSAQQQLEEKTLECSVLSRQLQQTLDDAQRQVGNYTVASSTHLRYLYFT